MLSGSNGLARSLPKPKYTGFEEELPAHTVSKAPRVVASSALLDGQVTLRKTGPPPYGARSGWKPRGAEDFADGGAFPECAVAQYPLEMGKEGSRGSSNALALTTGKTVSEVLANQGRSYKVASQFSDLIPLRQRADAGDIDLSRPSEEEVAESKRKTEAALLGLVTTASAAQKPKTIHKQKNEITYVKYTPSDNQMGRQGGPPAEKIIAISTYSKDPVAGPKFKYKKIPRGPGSPPPPVMHSPPRKVTADEAAAWRIPAAVSNWKNSRGYTIALDKRLAASGQGLEDNTINDKFSQFAESLYSADKLAREEVRQRAQMQNKLAERQEEQKAEQMRLLAQQAREERAKGGAPSQRERPSRRSRSRSGSYSSRSSSDSDSEEDKAQEREKARAERKRENERELRQSRMGAERKVQMMARESGRDISEKIALGIAKPTASGEAMYDSRLFGQSSGFAAGFNEDQPYDKPLFQAQDALSALYRPKGDQDDGEDEGAAYEKITKVKRFDGFSGAIAEEREGPVQFEREVKGLAPGKPAEEADPFGINDMIGEERGKATGKRRYGMQEKEEEREKKRARVSDDED